VTAKQVILIGWDAADWQIVQPLLAAGQMPVLRQLIQRGSHGNITTLTPILSPLLWTSIAAGKFADKHGILGFVEPDPNTGALRPVSSTSRKVKAVWNVLTQAGLRTHVVNWFASHPAEPINGVCISNLFPLPSRNAGTAWPLQPGTVHPKHLEETLAPLRVHPNAVGEKQLQSFVPRLGEALDKYGLPRLVRELAVALAESWSVTRVATWILENQPWDFLAVYFNAIDHVGHHFMPFYPPLRPGIPPDEYEFYSGVIPKVYRFHDYLLGDLLRLAGPEATVVLVSDHGFYSDDRRPPASQRSELKHARLWHRPLGMVCLAGPGVKAGSVVRGAGILDITPTILTLLGQPVAEDMDGRPLMEIMEDTDPTAPKRIPSWDAVPGKAGMHPPEYQGDPWEAQEALRQLADLGYLNVPTGDSEAAIRSIRRERTFNLALHLLETGRPADAIAHFETLLADASSEPDAGKEAGSPDPAAMLLYLARCRFDLKLYAACRELLERARQYEPGSAHIEFLLGMICAAEGKMGDALDHYLEAEKLDPRLPALHWRMGRAYLNLQRWEESARAFRQAQTLDPDSPQAHLGLAHVALVAGRFAEAAAAARQALARHYQLPEAHYVMGIALARQNLAQPALQAFQTCLEFDPRFADAHKWLAALLEQATGDHAKAAEHRRRASELSKD
jgi:tetratricopeptide (TPR) repeat protein